MVQKVDERTLNKMDKTFKILFIIGFIIQIIVAIIVTGNASTTPLTGWQVVCRNNNCIVISDCSSDLQPIPLLGFRKT